MFNLRHRHKKPSRHDGPAFLDLSGMDHIDLPGCTAAWENVDDAAGTTFSWINYTPDPDRDQVLPDPIERTDAPRIMGGTGWMVTEEGWHQYASWFAGHLYLPAPLRPTLPRVTCEKEQRISGRLANVLTDFNHAFGHVQREAAFRFFLLHEAGALDDCSAILAYPSLLALLRRHQPDILARYQDRIVKAVPRTTYHADAVVTAPHPSCSMNISRAQHALLSRYMIDGSQAAPAEPHDRVFVPRDPTGDRAIENYDETCALMQDRGFVVVDMGNVDNPSSLIHQAKLVVGTHGSNLIDVDFMTPGSAVLELMPSAHRKPYHLNSCRVNGAHYAALLCPATSPRATVHGPSVANIHVDADRLHLALDRLESKLAP